MSKTNVLQIFSERVLHYSLYLFQRQQCSNSHAYVLLNVRNIDNWLKQKFQYDVLSIYKIPFSLLCSTQVRDDAPDLKSEMR
jgi:hypothetical protein